MASRSGIEFDICLLVVSQFATMDASAYYKTLEKLARCKRLNYAVYLHRITLDNAPTPLQQLVVRAARQAGLNKRDFDVVKFSTKSPRLSLLSYPDFFTDPFPALRHSWTFEIDGQLQQSKSYVKSTNPPILHRKELLLPDDHPGQTVFQTLTLALELAGLFADGRVIGRRQTWETRLNRQGFRVENHKLLRRNGSPAPVEQADVLRHRTALSRNALSVPVRYLQRHGFLDGRFSFLDYGCGKGDDVERVRELGVAATGWDPYFENDGPPAQADVVNLGYVVNVIEDLAARAEALSRAYRLSKKLLVVAAMTRNHHGHQQALGDGVVTARNTFQKYYNQQELGEYIEQVLGRQPIAVTQGVFFVFSHDEDEQVFLASRYHRKHRGAATAPGKRKPRWSEEQQRLADSFWEVCLELGRLPHASEFVDLAKVESELGTPTRLLSSIVKARANDEFSNARRSRTEDVLVHLAMGLFEKRRSLSSLPLPVQRDVRAFLGTHKRALRQARELLFSVGDRETLREAAEHMPPGQGLVIESQHVYAFVPAVLDQLPPVFRVYVGCAAQLVGPLDHSDLIRVFGVSGQLDAMSYEDFDGILLPRLRERLHVNLRRQRVSVTDYAGLEQPPVLFMKSRYLPPEHPSLDEQRAFDAALEAARGDLASDVAVDGSPVKEWLPSPCE